MTHDSLLDRVGELAAAHPFVVALTGAGISAESGIPTFRGADGFWTQGSANHTPEEMATKACFLRDPETVWAWYLFRRSKCLAAKPNPAHHALVELERALDDRFALVTQNVDGLHRAAGSSHARIYEIHGSIARMRCSVECAGGAPRPLPESVDSVGEGPALSREQVEILHCRRCGAWMRPHVLWFDEYYTEANCRSDSALEVAGRADLLLVIGTTGATTLPAVIGETALRREIPIVDINPEAGVFARMAEQSRGGGHLALAAGEGVPAVVRRLIEGWGGGEAP